MQKKMKSKYQIKEIPGFEGYYADTDGNIYSCYNVGNHTITGKIRKQLKETDCHGRPRVTLCRDQKRHYRFVHQLILETFVGPRSDKLECCHNDGNNQNNKLSNLRWDTSKANSADMIRHGRSTRGIKNPQHKLTEEEVHFIRSLLKQGILTQWRIAEKFDITRSAINSINNKYTWKHLKEM